MARPRTSARERRPTEKAVAVPRTSPRSRPPKTSRHAKGKRRRGGSTDGSLQTDDESKDDDERTSMDPPTPKRRCKTKRKPSNRSNDARSIASSSVVDEVEIPDCNSDEMVEVGARGSRGSRTGGSRASSIANETVVTGGERGSVRDSVRRRRLMSMKKKLKLAQGFGKRRRCAIDDTTSEERTCAGSAYHFLGHLQGQVLSYGR
jgi:hypothetical protein